MTCTTPRFFRALVILACSLILPGPTTAAEPAPGDFAPLFNGHDLAGWHTLPGGTWQVQDGAILGTSPASEPKHGMLVTDKTYKNFILDLEFKYAKRGNAGVFLRVGDPKNHVDSGFEVQILDTFGKDPVGAHDCGGIIKTAAPSKNMAKPAGEWNHYVITCVGSRLEVEFNGERVIDLDLSTSAMKDRPLKGLIGFQDEGKPVSYRNVRIVELP